MSFVPPELIEAVPDDPMQIIPNKHLKPIMDALVRAAVTPDDPGSEMDMPEDTEEMKPADSKPKGEKGGSPDAGGAKVTPDQKARITTLLGLPADMPDEEFNALIDKAMQFLAEKGQDATPDALIAMLEGDEMMAANMAPSMGVSQKEYGTLM